MITKDVSRDFDYPVERMNESPTIHSTLKPLTSSTEMSISFTEVEREIKAPDIIVAPKEIISPTFPVSEITPEEKTKKDIVDIHSEDLSPISVSGKLSRGQFIYDFFDKIFGWINSFFEKPEETAAVPSPQDAPWLYYPEGFKGVE